MSGLGAGGYLPVECRAASRPDLPWIVNHLVDNGLPADDVEALLDTFVVAHTDGDIIGAACLEPHGLVGLLRSMVVEANHRNLGVAHSLWHSVQSLAQQRGITELYLLTETAESFFGKLGFKKIARKAAPEAIRNSRQFAEQCHVSAVLMQREV